MVLIRLNLALFIKNRYNDSSIAMTLGVVANICSFAYLSRVMDDGKTSEPPPQVIASRKDQVRANLINLTRLNFSPLKLLHYFSIIPHSLVNTRYFQLSSNVVDQQRYTIPLPSNEFEIKFTISFPNIRNPCKIKFHGFPILPNRSKRY